MTVKSFIRQLDDVGMANGLLDVIGLQVRRNAAAKLIGGIGILAAGALVGAGIGLAMAPMSGIQMRLRAKDGLNQIRQRVMSMGAELGAKAKELGEDVEARTSRGRGRSSSSTII